MKSFRNIPLPSVSLSSSPASATAAAVVATLGICLLFGSTWVITALTARFPWLVAPSTLGAPFGLPRLRVTPFGEQGWDALTIEVIAVVALTTVTGAWTRRALTRRPAVGRVRAGLSAWVGFVLGAVTANTLRAVAVGATMGFGLVGYGAIVVVGMLSGTVWGAALGWIPGIAAGVAIGRGASRTPAAPTTPTA